MIDIKNIIESSPELMELLKIIQSFHLPDSWLCADSLRNYIWNYLSQKNLSESIYFSDIDVIFYDENISYQETLNIEKSIKERYPRYNWEVRNQYYMHKHSPHSKRYTSSKDAVSKFPEKCTAIAARLDEKGQVECYAPYGYEDIIHFRVSPTPHFLANSDRLNVYQERIKKKNWQKNWPQLSIENIEQN
ncbi:MULTISPECIES: nucleotidyltransferase family protein [Aerococcus]|uniref:nucleotidyltransferase family protein n=1 Tax=Aerococcus TaxID=1375 RepID=UPI0007D90A12|nr:MULTISPECIES: nucleotidyltransferase family protein [Aerococcus]KAA9218149.1 nucleotidyltransferase family protein [Aerococcus loyolae]KAA9264786.1 nucleotidyltransferase family protein [Aerococcus loyolae]MCY3027965.1 nucleotidyltransferase family protein [Aerococcus loyolae]MDK6258628.1 nucleotidyltransferase family protein [Aerococcus urinae]MDK6294446.1 nucleotidyltransferase family protein [Aerococcus urinae]